MLRRERKGLKLFDNMLLYHIIKQVGGVFRGYPMDGAVWVCGLSCCVVVWLWSDGDSELCCLFSKVFRRICCVIVFVDWINVFALLYGLGYLVWCRVRSLG